ncbi:hypothetical protein [Patulibacter defluvii]|uniref:hypothetical protein n=1 Tax=Patulibacter defluvii TaxID=3095358 RepID=UPI002A762F75|nr:hypothetical protein [Patulibacter sp. DM4]
MEPTRTDALRSLAQTAGRRRAFELARQVQARRGGPGDELLARRAARVAEAVEPDAQPVALLRPVVARTRMGVAEVSLRAGLDPTQQQALALLQPRPGESPAEHAGRLLLAPRPAGRLACAVLRAELRERLARDPAAKTVRRALQRLDEERLAQDD